MTAESTSRKNCCIGNLLDLLSEELPALCIRNYESCFKSFLDRTPASCPRKAIALRRAIAAGAQIPVDGQVAIDA